MTHAPARRAAGLVTTVRRSCSTAALGVAMPNPRRSNGHRRDKLRRRVLAEEDTCWLCNKPVDKALHYLDPGAPEVDEVVPVSLGGSPYDRDNCRLAHRLCNGRRGNGTNQPKPAPQIETSRAW